MSDPPAPQPRDVTWAIVGAGSIASEFAQALPASARGRLVAVSSRSELRGRALARAHGAHYTPDVETMLASTSADVVYVATPHTEHERVARAALEAGKAVLCEKPMTPTEAGVQRLVDTARSSGRFLLEAFMFMLHPQTRAWLTLVRDGAIGDVVSLSVDFSFEYLPAVHPPRLVDPALAGGAILDIGCYPAAVANLLAQTVTGDPDVEPRRLRAVGVLSGSGVDLSSAAVLEYPGGMIARLSSGLQANGDPAIRVTGTRGTLTVPRPPWMPEFRQPVTSTLLLSSPGGEERIDVPAAAGVFAAEADHVAAHLRAPESPVHPLSASLRLARLLDRWRAEIGLRYPFEPG